MYTCLLLKENDAANLKLECENSNDSEIKNIGKNITIDPQMKIIVSGVIVKLEEAMKTKFLSIYDIITKDIFVLCFSFIIILANIFIYSSF